jgi:hypothetical protein
MQLPLALGALALTAVLAVLWGFRARAKRRLRAVLDAYAEGEIARAGRANAPGTLTAISVRWRTARGRSLNGESEEAKKTYSRRNLHARPQSQNR